MEQEQERFQKMLTLKNSQQCHKHRNYRGDVVEDEINKEDIEFKEKEYEMSENNGEGNAAVSSDDEDVVTTVDTVSTFLVASSSRYGRSFTFNKRYVSQFLLLMLFFVVLYCHRKNIHVFSRKSRFFAVR